ncbi:sensor histidine kinase [Gudongella sp. DL1XJH-153]|uniref:sensor histidine kinase n=1 Tax=Gudongella sp. DL1XJH-153 TaxID=3409804 RepID=UPI003BB796B3
MTIRKLLLIVMVFVVVLSVGINALILTSLTDQYFVDYLDESYEDHTEQIIEYTKAALDRDDISFTQMSRELKSHLIEPIIRIRLLDMDGRPLLDVMSDTPVMGGHMMNSRMYDRFTNNSAEEFMYEVVSDGRIVGNLEITRYGNTENTAVALLFKSALVRNSILSVLIALVIAIVAGVVISGRMAGELKKTSAQATAIQEGNNVPVEKSFIHEITSIRESLDDLSIRLKLRQKSRKELTDQLIHQTRTPLTILKTHLEAIDDGMVEVDQEEINILEDQIQNITAIVSNMSELIDAETKTSEINYEEVEINQLIKKIMAGLKPQFSKKGIQLVLGSTDKITITTDRYLLSQAIYNIMTNAYKYTDKGGKVVIDYSLDKNKLKIKINDTGIGILEKDKDKIFNAYYSVETDSAKSGEGIGLYVVSENLKHLGGNIKVESEQGNGSTFLIELPLNERERLDENTD